MRAFHAALTCIRGTVWQAVDLETQEVVAIKDIAVRESKILKSFKHNACSFLPSLTK
jgi:hypothetical protein